MADMRLGGEIAAARFDIVGVTANDGHKAVGRISKSLQIARLGHVAVIVGPVERDGTVRCFNQLVRWQVRRNSTVNRAFAHLDFLAVQQRARPPVLRLEAAHHRHQIVVADTLKLANGVVARLRI